jgi:cobalt-zinc-cadmium efflux system outer membrane protein
MTTEFHAEACRSVRGSPKPQDRRPEASRSWTLCHSALFLAMTFVLPGSASAASSQPDSPTSPGARVEELLVLVRSFNLELAAAALDSEEAVAKIAPAGALDDPTFNVGRDQGFRQTTFSASQEFPLWGKRALRSDIAEENARAAKSREGGVGKELEERVKTTFAQYYAAHEAIDVTQDIHALLYTLVGTVRTRYGQGLSTQSDAIRVDLEQTRLDPELNALVRDQEIAKARLNALIAHPAKAPLARPEALRKVPAVSSLKLDDLMAQARERNPALAAARAEIAAADGERRLVDKSYYPDVTVSLGGDALPNQSVQPTFGVGIKIPLQWGVRDAQAHAATAKKGAAQARLDGAMLTIESELQSALANLRQAQRTARLLRSTIGPQSQTAYQASLISYERGRGDLTAVLEAAHQQLQIRIELLRVETDEQTALAAIERLIGDDL